MFGFLRLLPLFFVALFVDPNLGFAQQQPPAPPRLNLGDAIVTGFSGTLAPSSSQPRPANKSAIDLTFINPDGPSARVIAIGRPGFVWDGRLLQAPKTFYVLAKDVGQVFGVALDDQRAPNIYLAATSAYGLQLVSRGRDGQPERRKTGGPAVGWMKGQFGLDLQGDPGSIYKIDGATGAVTLFAKVLLNGVPNPGPALGNLAYDAAHKQLIVSDLHTGMIHRFAIADGSEAGAPYDHGMTGRNAAKLPAIPFNTANRPNIATSRFNAENPDTWGFAPPERRVWAVAVHDGRLFYSARNGAAADSPQIWSVGLGQDGSFGTDARLEVDVPAQPRPYPVSDIAFSQTGEMIVAQRAVAADSYDYSAFTRPGEPRVLRFVLKAPNDPPSPGLWKTSPEEYAVGLAGSFRNTDGGVALGYGYDQAGVLSTAACDATLWTTGQMLRNNPAQRAQLEPGGPLLVGGLQGSPADALRPVNEPPTASYFVDYDDKVDDPRASGHLGSVRILTQPCSPVIATRVPAAAPPPPPPPPPGIITTTTNACTPTCVCPNGTVLKDGECVKTNACQRPMVMNAAGECVCPPHYRLINGVCRPEILMISPVVGCTPPMVPGPTPDTCRCPDGMDYQRGRCVPVTPPNNVCKAPLVPGPCECPSGMVSDGQICVPDTGILEIHKKVENHGPIPLPPGTQFQFTVSCGGSSFPLTDGGMQTINNIPVGSSCTISETMPGGSVCPRGMTPVWSTGWTPSSTVITHAGTTVVTAVNTLDCKKGDDGVLQVHKKVKNETPRPLPTNLSFGFTVDCGNASFSLADGGMHTINNVPVGSSCTVTENSLPTLPPRTCPPGQTPTWSTSQAPPNPVITHAGVTNVDVTNTLTCKGDTGTVLVEKKVQNNAPRPLPTGLTFQFSSNCGLASFSLGDGGSYVINNVPVGSNCTINEIPPSAPNVCPQGTTPQWTTTPGMPTQVITHAGQTVVGVLNTLNCVKAQACTPPLVMNAAGECVCPAPMVPVPGAIGQCTCPQGTVLNNGTCVPVTPVCQPPMVMNAAGVCVCPDGTVQQGRECVKVPVCPPPMVMNAAGVCDCPPGMVLRGKECVKVPPPPSCTPPMTANAAGVCACPSGTVQRGVRCIEQKQREKEKKRERAKEKKRKEPERKRQPNIELPRSIPGMGFPGGGGGRGGQGGSGAGGGQGGGAGGGGKR